MFVKRTFLYIKGRMRFYNYQLTKEEYYLVLMEKMPSKKFCRCPKSKNLARIHQQVLQDASRTATDLNHTDID